jgi:c-di-GMP-binding flagellar brake protein YcgR
MITVGSKLILEPKNSSDREKYTCKLVETSKEKLFIYYPVNIKTGKMVYLLDGTQLKVTFVTKDQTVYIFETEVQGRVKQEDIPLVILSFPGWENIIKIQRRQFVRVETAVDIAIHPLNGEFTPFVAVTNDISAGGAAVVLPSDTQIELGLIFNCWVVLPMQSGDYQYMFFKARVIRVIGAKNGKRNIMSFEFLDITSIERQLLIRFSFERELIIKRKGLNP